MPNPALNDGAFAKETRASQGAGAFTPGWGSPASELPTDVFSPGQTGAGGPVLTPPGAAETMRVSGTATATGVLLAILCVAGWFGWQTVTVDVVRTLTDGTEVTSVTIPSWLWVAWIGGLVLAIVTVVKPPFARVTGPLYAAAQGLAVGAISHVYEANFDGIVLQAVLLTIGVFAIMLVLFATGTIRVTEKLRIAVVASTLAIAAVYLVSWLFSLFGGGVPYIHDAGPIGIGFSLVVVGIASMNLLLDFDLVQRGVAMRAPRYMEWYAAFGLMVTLIWLYLEILRLLAKLNKR